MAKLEKVKNKAEHYYEAVGRHKEAVARVRLFNMGSNGDRKILINNKELADFFSIEELKEVILAPLVKTSTKNCFLSVKVKGGGVRGQARAARLGISRVLIKRNPELRPVLKKEGFLTRSSRVKERRKFGLKKARKARQWRKR
jgi:small subunit ribosomal protein S9